MKKEEIIAQCLSRAQAELNKIPYKDDYLKLELTYTHYEYVNGEFIQASEGDRGEIYRSKVADTPEEFTEYLIYTTVKRYAFRQEVKVRRSFEDNRRQVNEIIVDCYRYMNNKYGYTLMTNLKDNIHIYFDLLDYYIQVSKNYLDTYRINQDVQKRLSFIATKQYSATNGGIYDVAFSFEWVRYQVERFLELHSECREVFEAHDNQYQRLLELEKADPYNAEKYQLGTWDRDVFAKAEEILAEIRTDNASADAVSETRKAGGITFKGMTAKFLADKESMRERAADVVGKGTSYASAIKKTDSALQCAFYMLIVRLYTARNLEQDLEKLLALAKEVDITPFRKPLEQLFVTSEYGVFGRERVGLRENARNILGL